MWISEIILKTGIKSINQSINMNFKMELSKWGSFEKLFCSVHFNTTEVMVLSIAYILSQMVILTLDPGLYSSLPSVAFSTAHTYVTNVNMTNCLHKILYTGRKLNRIIWLSLNLNNLLNACFHCYKLWFTNKNEILFS